MHANIFLNKENFVLQPMNLSNLFILNNEDNPLIFKFIYFIFIFFIFFFILIIKIRIGEQIIIIFMYRADIFDIKNRPNVILNRENRDEKKNIK